MIWPNCCYILVLYNSRHANRLNNNYELFLGGLSSSLCAKDEKNFHSSVVYASAIHSMSTAFRFRPGGPISNTAYASGCLDIGEIVHNLVDQDRQNMVAILDISMPAPPLSGMMLAGTTLNRIYFSIEPLPSDGSP